MSYRIPNAGQQRRAEQVAGQIGRLPAHVQNRQARAGGLVVLCPTGRVVCRVFKIDGEFLMVPVGKVRGTRTTRDPVTRQISAGPAWVPAWPGWIEPGVDDEVRARCRCHSEQWKLRTPDLLARANNGAATWRLPSAIS